ncbi:Gfo/Idh/MocA family protein [Humibacter ginsenosidimutans]|uniref:Gfo/Idh/MocA family protein n=1 Tax=Humibacter ginsenosidimutans TaxID=2599293 RepID=UPI00143D8224|nr:Gfo/Idh/MocA family oxidoreductase [Humibacter ginsenosidimutans]
MAVELRPLRIGVAGLGAVAQSVHLPLVKRRWDLFDLVAVADLSATARANIGERFGVPAEHRHVTLRAMLDAEELDGVLLLTSGSHGEDAAECVRRGVAVFCEKPLAYSLAEIDRLREVEAQAGRPLLLLGYMKEYDAAVRRLADRLPEASTLRYVDVEVLHPSSTAQLAFANLREPVRDADPEALAAVLEAGRASLRTALGSAPADFGALYANVVLGSLIHDISLVRSLFGSIRDVQNATLWATQDDPGSIEISGTLAGDARVHVHWHYLADYPRYRETVTVHHTTGSLELEFTVPYLLNAPTELRIVSSDGVGESVEVVRDVTEAFETELVAFHRMVTEGVVPPTGSEQGARGRRHGTEDRPRARRVAGRRRRGRARRRVIGLA